MKKKIKMDPEDLQTRLNQEVITTSDPRKMLGMYTAKRVLRTWTEDFIDQDTGEIVTIERNDMIMERGVLLTPEQVSEPFPSISRVEILRRLRSQTSAATVLSILVVASLLGWQRSR